ncbi:alpha/beta hydrolase [Lutimonas halocynthiae]|uniref:alpha/beta hydrolase n=1 Tax=Lutimonas halocynthiae TaxID=1446477 RepID=UPI0025B393E6|nr:alpha/beta hydrolase [Lutimonas halocynthiae]MDN3643865.1 alpha/beta hydrolase [Lutimonas halocynthiae]
MKNIFLMVFLSLVAMACTEKSDKPASSNNEALLKEKKQGEIVLNRRIIPVSQLVSKEMQESLRSIKPPAYESMQAFPQTNEEWVTFIEAKDKVTIENAHKLAEMLSITVEKKEINGTVVRYISPPKIADKYTNSYFINIHGGAFILNGGDASYTEAMLIASSLQIPVISIDYHMPPEHPYPTGLNDAVAAYKGILEKHPNHNLFLGGTSAGGNITMVTTLKLIEEGVELPKALFLGTPVTVLNKKGDSFYTNENLDRVLGTWDGFLAASFKLYANGVDLESPYLSPLNANLSGFPPSILVTGTRDILLSSTVMTHLKLRDAGSTSDLMVIEGQSHGDYMLAAKSPESKSVYRELDKFLTQYINNEIE